MRILAHTTNQQTQEKELAFTIGISEARIDDAEIIGDAGSREIKFLARKQEGKFQLTLPVPDEIHDHYDGDVTAILAHVVSENRNTNYHIEKGVQSIKDILTTKSFADDVSSVQAEFSDQLQQKHSEISTQVAANHAELTKQVAETSETNNHTLVEENVRLINHVQEKSGEMVQFTTSKADELKGHIEEVMESSRNVLRDAIKQTTDVKFVTELLVDDLTANLGRNLYNQHKQVVEDSVASIEKATSRAMKKTDSMATALEEQDNAVRSLSKQVSELTEKVEDSVEKITVFQETLDSVHALLKKLEGALDD